MSTGSDISLGKLTLDASGILAATRQIDATMRNLAQGLERTMQGGAAQAQRLTRSVGQIAGQMLQATRATTQMAGQMQSGMRAVAQQMAAATSSAGQLSRQMATGFQQTNQSIQQLAATVTQLAQQVQAGFQQVAQQQQRTRQEADRGATAWTRFGEAGRTATQTVGRSLEPLRDKAREVGVAIGGLTAAVSAATVAGLKFGGDYEQAMARVKAVTQSSQSEFQKLDAYAKKLGIDTVYSAKDAADGMGYLAQGGYKVNQIMTAMRPAMDLAAVAQVGVGDASRILVNVMESMRIHVEDLPHTVDVLAKAMVSGGNDMMEFGEAFKYVGPVAKAAGVSLEETAATLQLLGKAGINASMGGTTLRGLFSILSQESGKLKKDFKSLGIEVYDASGKLKPLPDVIDQFNAALKDANRQGEATKLIMADIGQRAGPGFLSLMGLGGNAIRKLTSEMQHADGLAKEIADIQISTVKNKFGQLIESISTLGINFTGRVSQQLQTAFQAMNDWLGDNATAITDRLEEAWNAVSGLVANAAQSAGRLYAAWSPTLRSLWQSTTQLYQSFMQWFGSLPQGVQDAIKAAAAMTAISVALGKVGGSIPIVGGFATALGNLLNPVGLLSTAIRVVIPLLSGAGGLIPLLGMLFSPVGLVIAGVTALTALVGYMNGDVAGAFKSLGQIIDTVTLGSLTRLLDLLKLKDVKGMFTDLVNDIKSKMETSARAQNQRDQVKTRYGDVALQQYDEADAANKRLTEHNRQVMAAKEHYERTGSYRDFGDASLVREHEARQYRMRTGGYEKSGDAGLLAATDKLAADAKAAQDRYEQTVANAEKSIQQKEQSARQQSANAAAGGNEQQVKQEQQWRDQQQAQDQQALAPQIAQGQQAVQEASPNKDLAAVQSGQYAGYFNSMTSGQAADYFKSAPKAVADALKPDKEGKVNTDKATSVAQTYIAGLKQVGGLNQGAVDQLSKNLTDAIARVRDAPPALRDMLIDQLNQVDVKMHQIFDSNGTYSQQFAHSLGAALKQALGDAVKEATDKANAAAATLGLRVDAKFGNFGGAGQAFRGAAGAQAAAGQARIKAQQDKLKQAIEVANNPQLAPAAQQAANDQVAQHQADLDRIVAEEQQKAVNTENLAPGNFNRLAIGQENAAGQKAIRDLAAGGNDLTAPQQKQQLTQIKQQWQSYMDLLQQAAAADKKDKEKILASAVQAQNAFQDMVNAANRGVKGFDDFNAAQKRGADAAKKLAEAEEKLTDDEIAKMNARGIFTQKQQAAQQAAMQQFAQQAQQGLQQGMQQMQDMLKQGGEAQQQAAADMDQQIGDALKSGDPQKIKAALDLFKGYAQAQIQQTLLNVANAAGEDSIRVSFGTLSQPGILPTNLDQRLAANPQAAATVKLFQALLAQLDAAEQKIPKLAAGGIVTGPTNALIGERGPEAVIPLSQLGAMFGNPAGMFSGSFGINPGGGSINPFGLSMGRLGAFGAWFNAASNVLNRQLDLGNRGAQALLDRFSQVQQGAEDALGWVYQHRQINLGGNGPVFGRRFGFSQSHAGIGMYGQSAIGPGMSLGSMELHFHGVDISQPGAAQKFAEQLLPALNQQVVSRGFDMTGRRPINFQANGRSPLRPAGLAR